MTSQPGNNQGSGTTTPQPPAQETPGAAPAPAYITPEALQAQLEALQEKFQESLNNTYRGIQSMNAKTKNQLDQLDGLVKQLNAAGQAIDPAALQRVKTDIMAGAYSGEAQPSQPVTPPGQGEPQGQEDISNDPFVIKMKAFQEAFGVEILDEDPEAQVLLKIGNVDDATFFAAVKEQLEAKKARLASDTPQRSVSRSPMLGALGGPASNPIAGINDPDQLWELSQKPK